jgi:hypothetical protein
MDSISKLYILTGLTGSFGFFYFLITCVGTAKQIAFPGFFRNPGKKISS